MTQARIVDIHVSYRTGGVNWDLLKVNCDAVIIQAGVGTWTNPILREQVDGAVAHGVPYMTYHIPDITDGPMSSQVDFYLSLPGVRDAWACADIEPPWKGCRCVNPAEALAHLNAIEDKTGKQPLLYSNPKYLREALGEIWWITDYWLWIAQWPYKPPLYLTQYTDFESFLAKNANTFPAWVRGNRYQAKTILWQYSAKGDAQRLCANARTNDPIYQTGILEADLDVSTIEKTQLLEMFGNISSPPPALPASVTTKGKLINIRNAPDLTTTSDIGDITATKLPVIGESGEFWKVTGYVAKSVTEPI